MKNREFSIFSRFFRYFRIPIAIPGILGFLEFRNRDFLGFSNPDPNPQDYGIFGIFQSGQEFKVQDSGSRSQLVISELNKKILLYLL